MTLNVQIASWPGAPDRPNEDWAATAEDVVIVLDGAGISKHLPTGCQHSVEWFVKNLGPSLLQHAMDRQLALTDALEQAILDVRDLHDHLCDLSNPNSPSATVVVLRLNGDLVEGLVLCDSTLVIAHASGEVRAISDDRLQQVMDRLTAEGQLPPSGSVMSEHRNQPGGFWVAGARPDAAHRALTDSWKLDAIDAAALLTDGATRLVDLFEAASWPKTMQLLADGGPEAVLKPVRDLEDADADGILWRRSKSHDDATVAYVRR